MAQDEIEQSLDSDYLKTAVRSVADLTAADRDRMYEIMSSYFGGVSRRQFESDLDQKDWVFLANSVATGETRGFSTLVRWRLEFDGKPVTAYFSGDTVIDPAYWGRNDGVRVWLRHVMQMIHDSGDENVYWLLLTSTYVSYLFLPRLFRDYFPKPNEPTPTEIKRLLEVLTCRRFPNEYDAERGVVVLQEPTQIRSGEVMIDPKLANDPHVAYFLATNTGYGRGDFLACIAKLEASNLMAMGRRFVEG